MKTTTIKRYFDLNIKMYLLMVAILLVATKVAAQSTTEVNDYLDGHLPSNYVSLEGAITPGFSASAGFDSYVDINRIRGKEEGNSWVVTGQFYFYKSKAKDEKFLTNYGHLFGTSGGGFKIGGGYLFAPYKSTRRMTFIMNEKNLGTAVLQERQSFNAPVTKATGLFMSLHYENSGKNWSLNSNGNTYINDGGVIYLLPSIRCIAAWNYYSSTVGHQRQWRWFDIGFPVSTDFKQYGIRFEIFEHRSVWTSRFGFGFIYRSDTPTDIDSKRTGSFHYYIPVYLTLGIGGNFIKASQGDKNFNQK
jgi:hypothetical protein